jgi:hypothetical protein
MAAFTDGLMNNIIRDLRLAARQLWMSKGYALAAGGRRSRVVFTGAPLMI